jgi:mannosyltransferase OCH1-like enzyme
MIPRILHQIWLGTAPLHPNMRRWRETWQRLHPSWTFKFWHAAGPAALSCGRETVVSRFPDLLARACHNCQRANIWRLELLAVQGGLYADTDVEPLCNIDVTIAPFDTFCMRMWQAPEICSNALIGATPAHPFLLDALTRLPTKDPTISLSMGDALITETVRGRDDVHIFPREVMLCHYKRELAERARPTAETVLVHHFGSVFYPTGYRTRKEEIPA